MMTENGINNPENLISVDLENECFWSMEKINYKQVSIDSKNIIEAEKKVDNGVWLVVKSLIQDKGIKVDNLLISLFNFIALNKGK